MWPSKDVPILVNQTVLLLVVHTPPAAPGRLSTNTSTVNAGEMRQKPGVLSATHTLPSGVEAMNVGAGIGPWIVCTGTAFWSVIRNTEPACRDVTHNRPLWSKARPNAL